jgi:hypothetical protein
VKSQRIFPLMNTPVRRSAGRLGLDFVVAIIKMLNKQLDAALESVLGATMSSMGFVTFLDLSSMTCADYRRRLAF